MFALALRRFKAWIGYHNTIRRLGQLDDWLLKDIGTQRDNLADYAAEHSNKAAECEERPRTTRRHSIAPVPARDSAAR